MGWRREDAKDIGKLETEKRARRTTKNRHSAGSPPATSQSVGRQGDRTGLTLGCHKGRLFRRTDARAGKSRMIFLTLNSLGGSVIGRAAHAHVAVRACVLNSFGVARAGNLPDFAIETRSCSQYCRPLGRTLRAALRKCGGAKNAPRAKRLSGLRHKGRRP